MGSSDGKASAPSPPGVARGGRFAHLRCFAVCTGAGHSPPDDRVRRAKAGLVSKPRYRRRRPGRWRQPIDSTCTTSATHRRSADLDSDQRGATINRCDYRAADRTAGDHRPANGGCEPNAGRRSGDDSTSDALGPNAGPGGDRDGQTRGRGNGLSDGIGDGYGALVPASRRPWLFSRSSRNTPPTPCARKSKVPSGWNVGDAGRQRRERARNAIA